MNEKQKARWEKTRARGKWRYILIFGIFWGLFSSVSTSLAEVFLFSGDLNFHLRNLPTRIVLFVTGGFALALYNWYLHEEDYKKSA